MLSIDRFIQERKWLHNVTPKTASWHAQALRWLPCEQPTGDDLKTMVFHMREHGLRATSCNTYLRSINAFLHWSGSPLRVPKLKEESSVPSTYTGKQVAAIARWKPRTPSQSRLHALLLTLFDTGVRLDEALSLRVADVNMDDLLLTVAGKGRKQRVIPFSRELRREMARHVLCSRAPIDDYVFSTRTGRKLSARNALRDTKSLCTLLGFPAPRRTLHATRHTFATMYLQRGGSLFHLQKQLGHSSLEMVRQYAHLATADLQAVHDRLSPLAH